MTFTEAVRRCLGNYATFSGRARRSEYWFWFLFVAIVAVTGRVLDAVLGTSPLFYVGLVLLTAVPNLAVGARRLHDTGRSGWWQLLNLIPCVGFIVLVVFYCLDSEHDNAYGINPKIPGGLPAPRPFYPPFAS